MNTAIKIDKYVSEIEHGRIVIYALAGKKKILMPDAYKDMYDDEHLAIVERELTMPELYGLKERKHYIPLYTGKPSLSEGGVSDD